MAESLGFRGGITFRVGGKRYAIHVDPSGGALPDAGTQELPRPQCITDGRAKSLPKGEGEDMRIGAARPGECGEHGE